MVKRSELLKSIMKCIQGNEDEQVFHRDFSRKHTFSMNDRADIMKVFFLCDE